MSELKGKQKGNCSSPSFAKMKRNKFFRVINESNMQSHQIEFPSAFVEVYGDKLPEALVLKVRTGDFWNIKVKKFVGRIRTLRGWQSFVEHYSIGFGYCLFFTYDGVSSFDVVICDAGDAEIDYPSKHHKFKNLIHEGTELGESTSKECRKNSAKNLDATSSKEDIHQRTEIGEPSVYRAVEDMAPKDVTATKKVSFDTQAINPNENVQSANVFKLKHPFFTITMYPNYIFKSSMTVPKSFMMCHLPGIGSATLQVSEGGKKWPVEINNHRRVWRRTKGLSVFLRESNIKVRDTCLFELINKKDALFHVHIISQ